VVPAFPSESFRCLGKQQRANAECPRAIRPQFPISPARRLMGRWNLTAGNFFRSYWKKLVNAEARLDHRKAVRIRAMSVRSPAKEKKKHSASRRRARFRSRSLARNRFCVSFDTGFQPLSHGIVPLHLRHVSASKLKLYRGGQSTTRNPTERTKDLFHERVQTYVPSVPVCETNCNNR